MSLFRNKKRETMENILKVLPNLNISSKASLKQFCLLATKCDVEQAEKLYTFLMKDMDELPMFDPVKPTTMQNIKTTATDVFSFIKENGNEIQQGVAIIRGLFGKGAAPVTEVPPVVEPIPPIN